MSERSPLTEHYYADNEARFDRICGVMTQLAFRALNSEVDLKFIDRQPAIKALTIPFELFERQNSALYLPWQEQQYTVARSLGASLYNFTEQAFAVRTDSAALHTPASGTMRRSQSLKLDQANVEVSTLRLNSEAGKKVADHSTYLESDDETAWALAITRIGNETVNVLHTIRPLEDPLMDRWRELISRNDVSARIIGKLFGGAAKDEGEVDSLISSALDHLKPGYSPDILEQAVVDLRQRALSAMEGRRIEQAVNGGLPTPDVLEHVENTAHKLLAA